jgi:predicted GIY-YIG superfamily endonuclease|uniref:GIY-YIG nuclease superfamily protein n=1 Tax=CrAss-like virus sp. ctRQZ5 TaxID=2826824 RepID=A0A8S5LXY1_9CAUD|nr:MAG TPA: GIY-YIG nuclease superfamily protein [CrAss-like virus sp. ctRQZ5]
MSNYKFKELKKVPKSAGIYSICNLLNNKRYIGSTNNFYNRFHEHKCLLRNNKHHSLHL